MTLVGKEWILWRRQLTGHSDPIVFFALPVYVKCPMHTQPESFYHVTPYMDSHNFKHTEVL